MIVIDSHVHSKYSFDSNAEPRDMIEAAIARGIKNIAFTEHLDIDDFNCRKDFCGEFEKYFAELSQLKSRFADKIGIAIGLEAGFADYNGIIANITSKFPFEYIINSVHVHNGIDYFTDLSYLKVSKFDFFEEYLGIVYDSLFAPYKFDAIGHFGYPSRIARYENNALSYKEHAFSIDKILKKAISDDIIIEVNTSVYQSVHPFLPNEEIVSRYLELGGKYITFSSDAHRPASLGRSYEPTIAKLKKLGLRNLTKSINGKKELLPI